MRFKFLSAYSVLAYLNQFVNVLVNIMFIKTLSLHTLGEIAIAKIWMQAMDYSHLGLRFSLDRYVPIWDRKQSAVLLWICIGVSSLVSGVIISVISVITENKLVVLSFSLCGYGMAIATILKNYYRATGDSRHMLTTYFISPTIPTVTQAVAFYFWGFNGFLTILAITSILAAMYLLIKIRSTALGILQYVFKTIISVRLTTITLLINSIIIFLSFSVDRMILNVYSSKEIVGEYSIILFAFSLLLTMPSTLAEFVFPNIVSNAVIDKSIYLKKIYVTLIPTMVAVVMLYFSIPLLITKFTSYTHLIEQIKLVLLGAVPYAVTPLIFHFMTARDMRKEVLISAATTLCIYTLILVYGGMHAENKLEYFTIARVANGYILLGTYAIFLVIDRNGKTYNNQSL